MIWIILVGVGVGVLVLSAGLCRAAARDERDRAEAERLPWDPWRSADGEVCRRRSSDWEVRRQRSADWRDR